MLSRISPLLVLLFALSAGAAPLCAAPKPVYSLVLNGDREQVKGEPPILCVYLNGNPVGVYTNSFSIGIQANQFLRKGKNEIRLTDTAKRAWSVQFGMTDGEKEPVLVLEKDVDLAGKGEWSATVDLPNVDWTLPLFEKEVTEAQAGGPEIPKFMEGLFNGIAAADKTPVVSLIWNNGMSVWMKEAYGQPEEAAAGGKQFLKQTLENIAKLEETPTAAKMKIIRGKNAVLVYTGVVKEEISSTAYLATFKNRDGSAAQVPPTILYQTKDGWAIWQ